MIRRGLRTIVAMLLAAASACNHSASDSPQKRATQDRTEANATALSERATTGQVGASAATEANPTTTECKPNCGAICGVDDGCGSKCPCAAGEDCVEQICIDRACGPCRPNERCSQGKCECVPDCAGRACQPDGCGNTCECPAGNQVNGSGQTVAATQCKDTCEAAGWKCGDLCGVSCGMCPAHQACSNGICKCVPTCDGTSCSDGCGGSCECATGTVCDSHQACVKPEACKETCASRGATCGLVCGLNCGSCDAGQACIDGQCREALSCTDCGLQLRLLERTLIGGKIARVALGVELNESPNALAPRLIDLRISADRTVELVDAVPGPALLETGKELFKDEVTRKPWQRRTDLSYQLLAYTLTGTLRVKSGRVMTLTFDLAESGPVRFALQRHVQTFAPLDADSALQASQYEQAVVVSQ